MANKTSRNFYLDHLHNVFNFQGRMRRRDYFGALVIDYLIMGLLAIPGNLVVNNPDMVFLKGVAMVCGLVNAFIYLVLRTAAMIRRTHDAGYRGWWILCPFFDIILTFFDSEAGDNAYGPNPKG